MLSLVAGLWSHGSLKRQTIRFCEWPTLADVARETFRFHPAYFRHCLIEIENREVRSPDTSTHAEQRKSLPVRTPGFRHTEGFAEPADRTSPACRRERERHL